MLILLFQKDTLNKAIYCDCQGIDAVARPAKHVFKSIFPTAVYANTALEDANKQGQEDIKQVNWLCNICVHN